MSGPHANPAPRSEPAEVGDAELAAAAPSARITTLSLLAALAAVMALHAWSLLRYPAPYVDEVWILSRAWGWLHSGVPFGELDVGVLDLVPNGFSAFGLTGTILQSLPLIGASEVGLLGPRVEMLLAGLGLLVVMFAIGRQLADARLGALVALLTALCTPFFNSAHLARPEIIVSLFGYGALALHLLNTRHGWLPSALAGTLLGLGADVHPNASLLLLPIGLLFLLEFGLGVLRRAHFWSFALSALLVIAVPLAAKIFPDPRAYAANMALLFGVDHAPPLFTLDLDVLARSPLQTAHLIGSTFAGGAPVWAGCVAWLLYRRDRLGARVAAIAFGVLLSFVLLVRSKKEFYALAFAPALELVVACCLYQLLFSPAAAGTRLLRGVLQVIAVGLVAGMIGAGLPPLERDGFAEYRQAQQRINAVVRPHDSVMGRQQYWLGLQGHAFFSWEALAYYGHAHPGTSLETAFAVYRPDVLIIDQGLGQFITDQPQADEVVQYLRLPAGEMRALLSRHGTLLAQFPGVYGLTMVFRMH